MDPLSARLDRLGGAVSDTAERLTDPGELEAARRLLLQSPALAPWRLRRAARPALVAAAGVIGLVVVLVAAVSLVTRRSAGQVSFVVGSPPEPGAPGSWVAADREARLLQFSEGTSFTLAPGATARVTETTAHGATLLLERGDLTAAVVHAGAETRWDLRAGPFDVRVTGTRFEASWDPATETFELSMEDGVVVVKGPLLQAGRELWAGERLRVSVRDGRMDLHTSGGPPLLEARPAVSVTAPAVVASGESAEDPRAGAPRAAPASPRDPTWRDLAAAGKYDEALSAVDRAGFAQEIERSSSADLAALADAARYAARPALARQAVMAQRRRFGVRGASAFVLGKIAADQQGAAGEGLRWFETYLREEPNGALAEQALGRILQMQKGDPAAARATAARYLARYPSGVHAALARSLLTP